MAIISGFISETKMWKRKIRRIYPWLLPLLSGLSVLGIYFIMSHCCGIRNEMAIIKDSRSEEIIRRDILKRRSPRQMNGNTWPTTYHSPVDCKQIIDGNRIEIGRARDIMRNHPKTPISTQAYINLSENCEIFRKKRGYITGRLKREESEFPIAFGISIYKDIEQFERLLRILYRPQNYYCIHVDRKSPKDYHDAVENIANCFPNVILASRNVDVQWGHFSVLETYLICLNDLLVQFKKWRYFINLTGQEFPLVTNSEMVERLKKLNGRSIVPHRKKGLLSHVRNRYYYVHNGTKQTEIAKTPFRYNFTYFKGSTYVILSHSFAKFSLTNPVAKEFLEWVKDTGHPDETFYSTLFSNLHLVNATVFIIKNNSTYVKPRYVKWRGGGCRGKLVRSVCIHGIGSLKVLTRRSRELFVNKLYLDYEYFTFDCMEQWLYNKTALEDHHTNKVSTM